MSSKTRIIAFALAFAFMAGFAFSAQADVTGSFSTHIGVTPQGVQTPSEVQPLDFDIQNGINITVVISGLSTTLHSHFGLAGVEDVQLTYAATLGALDINGQFVFGRFTGVCQADTSLIGGDGSQCIPGFRVNNPYPLTDDLLFIKKRVNTSISLGGVSFSNLAMFEDVNWPNTLNNTTHQTSDQEFAFGDVLTLSGQTPSGVSINATTGICASLSPNVIKKHDWQYEVNPDCAASAEGNQGTKPELMFDFEKLNISGVPVASGVTASANVTCVQTTKCTMTNTFAFSGMGPVPFSASFIFTDLFSLAFSGADLTISSGPATFVLELDDTGQLTSVDLDLATTLNPDTNPATFTIDSSFTPGVGLSSADVGLSISRSNVDFGITASFAGGPPANFDEVSFSLGTAVGPVDISTSATFGAFGFDSSDTTLTINF